MAILDTPSGFRVYLVELEAWEASSNTLTTLRYSNHSFITKPSDSPPNTIYSPRVNIAMEFGRNIYSPGAIGGASHPGSGFIELNNQDGGLDSLYSKYLLLGRNIVVKYGDQFSTYSSMTTVLVGVISEVEFSEDSITIHLKDNQELLKKEISLNEYSSSNTFNESLFGRPLPLCYGECYNISPLYVGKVEASGVVTELTYQVHDGPIQDVLAVYSNGALISPTYITKDLPNGKFTIDISSVSSFNITADVKGDSSGSGYIDKIPDIMQRILEDKAPEVPLVLSRFTELSSDSYFQGSPIASAAVSGIFIKEGGEVEDAIKELSRSIGAYYGFDRLGRFDVGIFFEPSPETSIGEITDAEILSISRRPVMLPSYKHRVGYKRNYTVMDSGTIAEVVVDEQADRHAFLQEEYREATALNTESGILKSDNTTIESPADPATHWTIQDRYPTSKESELVESVMVSQNHAELEARRRWNLYNKNLIQKSRFEIVLKTQPFQLDLNDVIYVASSRYGLDQGKYLKIVSFKESAFDNEGIIEVWG